MRPRAAEGRRLRAPLCALVATALSAATVGCGRIPATHYYVLEPRAAEAASTATVDGDAALGSGEGITIGVMPFHVDPPYDQDRIVYRVGEDSPEVGFYEYHRWAAPLSRMLPRVVAAEWTEREGIQRIEPVQPGREYDARLFGRLLVLEEVDRAGGAAVRLKLTLSLSGRDGREIWRETAVRERAVERESVNAVVAAVRTLLADTLRERGLRIDDSIAGRPPRSRSDD